MIRHEMKPDIDIIQLLIDLETPSKDNIDELNRILGKYLDKVTQPLNLSFWDSVNYKYWSYVNLLKLTGLTYDDDATEFYKKIYKITTDNIRTTPELDTIIEPKRWIPNLRIPPSLKYAAGGLLALVLVGATVKYVQHE